jgi:hypothetical protein
MGRQTRRRPGIPGTALGQDDRYVQRREGAKETLARAAPALPSWRFHDFRRSFVTALGEAGVNETVADSILNHRQSATRGGGLGVYQRAQRWPEQVGAMTAWGRMLADTIKGAQSEPENILPMVRAHGWVPATIRSWRILRWRWRGFSL